MDYLVTVTSKKKKGGGGNREKKEKKEKELDPEAASGRSQVSNAIFVIIKDLPVQRGKIRYP